VQIPRLREWRETRALSQVELAELADLSSRSVAGYEAGAGARPATVRRLAEVLGVEVTDLRGDAEHFLVEAPTSQQLTLNGALEEERRAVWEAAADEARRLRETGEAQMRKALAGWSASNERGEPYATRREYLDEMGDLLQEVYGAYVAVGEAYVEAALTQGGDEASVPSYLKEESRVANDFYVELFGLVRSAGLGIRTGADAAAAKRAVEDQPEARSYSVEEPEAA